MTSEEKKNLTNTNDYWKKYPVGKYSGNERLNPLEMEERKLDNEFSRQLWLEEMPDDQEFSRHVENKLNRIKQSISITADPDELDITLAGQSHIDMAWKWRYEQTREKGSITFRKAMFHAKKYPGKFNYCASEPILFDWFKEDDPEGFEELKQVVKDGGIELVGGSYVEPDCMMPSGEAFVRSRLYGMKFYKDHFDILPKVEWFLDSFGYNYGLPQILKKSGAEYFWTSKITWNRQTIFPFVNFWWESPDGTRLLTSNFKQNWSVLESWMQFEIGRHPISENGLKEWDYAKKDYEEIDEDVVMEEIVPIVAVFAGKGDGGHGPTHEEVAFDQKVVDSGFAHWGKAHTFFEKLGKYGDQLPIWQDELYLEYHRGTFSVHWEVKRHNRFYENKLVGFENLATLLDIFDESYELPLLELESLWKVVLLNQFHDVLPGSSIPEVYDDVYAMWMECNGIIEDLIEKWKSTLPVPENTQITLSNQLSWKRKSPVFIPLSAVDKGLDTDGNGKPPYVKLVSTVSGQEEDIIFAQPVGPEVGDAFDESDTRPSGWYVVVELEAFATKSYRVEILGGEETIPDNDSINVSPAEISNGLVSIELDEKTGAMLKMQSPDVNGGNNLLQGKDSNLTEGYLDDFPHDHAWNIKPEYWKYPLTMPNDNEVKLSVLDEGPVFATIKISKVLGEGDIKPSLEKDSTIGANLVTQTLRIFKGCPTVFLSYESNWKQPWLMLKVGYNTSTEAEFDTSGQCYCSMERSTRPETRPDKARYEKIMHKYVDLSTPSNEWGLAMLNEGKYAYDASEGKMRLTMLRTPKYPGPAGEAWVLRERVQRKKEDGSSVPEFVDLGMLRCRYALLPHEGGALKKSDETENHLVAYKSEEFNNPVIVQSHGDSNTSLDASNSFLTDGSWLMKVYSPNVQVTSLKEKQWVESKNKILRVVEKCGVDTPNCQIALHPKIAEKVGGVKIVDLLERDLAGGNSAIEWDSKKGVITCNLGKFEILSLELEMK